MISQSPPASRVLAAGFAASLTLVLATGASAQTNNPIADLNAMAQQAVGKMVGPVAVGRAGPIGLLDLALVHVAVYDAVQSIERRYEPFFVQIPDASGSAALAAGKAARDVLVGLYGASPEQLAEIQSAYTGYLDKYDLSEADPGWAVGRDVAAAVLPAFPTGLYRANPSPLPPAFTGGTQPGDWRPTTALPPATPFAPMTTPWLGDMACFTLVSRHGRPCAAQFRVAPPPDLGSRAYRKAYDEVKALGALVDSSRTQAQTDLGLFYSDNTPAVWARTLQGIARTYVDDVGDSARMFALAYLSAGDGVIAAWYNKKHFNFWRPVTAIWEGDYDTNPRTDGDPSWMPLINTPPYPDHTSGANTLTGAMTGALRLFFGKDRKTFSVTSTIAALPVEKRTLTYKRFSQMADDVVDVRIYQGIHFRFADAEGRKQGERIAEWVFRHFLQPVDEDDEHDDDCDHGDHDRGWKDR